ncbi:MAG: carcinine hydrolase/isopenicillin-N N-acyltransferase family protein [Eubacteriales bacterium]|nr:carcinine hydrolase/isopenicillin-N N-acyltransferase family protein [Eubacteriales bacterium]
MKRLTVCSLVVVLFFLSACNNGETEIQKITENNAEQTLLSFEAIDPHPAYVMNYFGDYALPDALLEGMESEEAVSEHFSDLYKMSLSGASSGGSVFEGKACTGFSASSENDETYFCHNEDWEKSEWLILRTDPKNGYSSYSVCGVEYDLENENDLLELPFYPLAGMNNKGLAVSTYSVPVCEPSSDADRPSLIWPLAIRMLLDQAASVDEAITLLNQYNILIEEGNGMQFFIGDAGGDSAIIQWIDGEIIPLKKDGDWQVVTNFIQQDAPDFEFQNCWRYQKAENVLMEHANKMTAESSMKLLADTSQSGTAGDGTQFSVVFNLTEREFDIVFGKKYENSYSFGLE